MKYIHYILSALALAGSLSLSSCKNEVDDVFDKSSAERLNASVEYFHNILLDQGGKWQMEYFTQDSEQGYVYLMTFNKDGSVRISGNNPIISQVVGSTATTAYASQSSMWEIITDDGPVLTFNTYNPIFHIFADPKDDPGTTQTSEQGYGHYGDYEFKLMRYTGDTLYVNGKKRGLQAVMTRLDPDTDDEAYLSNVVALADSFFTALIPITYITMPNGSRYLVRGGASLVPELCPEYKRDTIDDVVGVFKEGWTYFAEKHNALITPAGLTFMQPITLTDTNDVSVVIQHFKLQPDGSLLSREDGVTTLAADTINKLFFDPTLARMPKGSTSGTPELAWTFDSRRMEGQFLELYNAFTAGMASSSLKATVRRADLLYDETSGRYSMLMRTRKVQGGTVMTLNAFLYFDTQRIGTDRFRLVFNGEGDANALNYVDKVAQLRALLDKISATTFRIEANSKLAPTRLKLIDVDNESSFLFVYLQKPAST